MRDKLNWDSYWGSCDRSVVDTFERKIGRNFPELYKQLVSRYNGAFSIGRDSYRFFSNLTKSEEVYGLGILLAFGCSDSETDSMQWSWANRPEFFPEGLVPFARDGGGNLICFDYRKNPENDNPPIVVWHHEGRPRWGEDVSFVSNCFGDFLDSLFEG